MKIYLKVSVRIIFFAQNFKGCNTIQKKKKKLRFLVEV